MNELLRDIDETLTQGKFTHESLNWILSFKREIEWMNEVLGVYEMALKSIAGLDGTLTGEDATCFKTWAEEALEACDHEVRQTIECVHPKGYIKFVRICGLCGEQLSG